MGTGAMDCVGQYSATHEETFEADRFDSVPVGN